MKKVNCYLFYEPVGIANALLAVASQEGNNGPKYALMVEAVDRIRFLESLLDISSDVMVRVYDHHTTTEYDHQSVENYINDWINTNKDMPPDFVKIVEDNFWEMLA